MYITHRNDKLRELFSLKPYQGADPSTSQFLFFGLDANYASNIEHLPCFPEILDYLADGVRYWRQREYHHPFRHREYRGDGALYHKRFAEIGFTKEHADLVSFVELIDVPTTGRSDLRLADLKTEHIDRLRDWTLEGRAVYIFMPPSVHCLLRRTKQFSWLPAKPIARDGALPVLWRTGRKAMFSPYHFSYYGKNYRKKDRDDQLRAISALIKK